MGLWPLAVLLCAGLLLYAGLKQGGGLGGGGPEGEYLSLQEAANLSWLLADMADTAFGAAEPVSEASAVGFGAADPASDEADPDFGAADTSSGPADEEADISSGMEGASSGRKRTEAVEQLFTAESAAEGEGMLTFGLWEEITGLFPEYQAVLPEGYRKKDKVLLADWYAYFDGARAVYDREGRIQDLALVPLGCGAAARDPEGRPLEERELAAGGQTYLFMTDRVRDCLFRPVTAVARDGVLYAVRSVDGQESRLSNVWLMEVDGEQLRVFDQDYEIAVPAPDNRAAKLGAVREQVGDLSFVDGSLSQVHLKTEKVSGKLLKVRDGGAEIEGEGFWPFADDVKLYRLHGKLKTYAISDLRIGYDFADFVVEDGRIQAALAVKEETMENIRVLVKTSNYGSAWHESVELLADCDLRIQSGAAGAERETILPAGEKLVIDRESELFQGGKVCIEPSALTGRISLLRVERSQGIPSYRGRLELELQEDGIVVVNEVLLEEYLYAVVPSEMPSSYPLEALKAQAVCARTYAYAKMLHAGLPAYGAHVDDSAGFQVYNNVKENVETTKAVKETKGKLLYYGEELADAFYYSTSCGYGTNTAIWSGSDPARFPYLAAKAVNVAGVTDSQGDAVDAGVNEADIPAAQTMTAEESFASFIKNTRASDWEKEEPWYRWTYRVEALDSAHLYENVKSRYAASPNSVCVRKKDGSFGGFEGPEKEKLDGEGLGRITNLYISARNQGGVAAELVIEGENGAVLVKSEHNIRYVLSDGSSQVIRQDGSTYQAGNMLPSAFLAIDLTMEEGFVAGYTLTGGGFGHGVGLSQNGARSMAQSGCDSRTILEFFYEGSDVKGAYTASPGQD